MFSFDLLVSVTTLNLKSSRSVWIREPRRSGRRPTAMSAVWPDGSQRASFPLPRCQQVQLETSLALIFGIIPITVAWKSYFVTSSSNLDVSCL